MGLKLQIVENDDEFPALMVAMRKGFTNPGHPIWPLYTADLKPYSDAQTKAVLDECAQRFIEWHHHDPTSVWMKVIDEETNEIAAGARWSVFKKDGANPYDNWPQIEATWFPEGDLRVVGTKLVNEFLASAVRHVNRPHVFLNIIFTVPEYRRKGAASMIMDWGNAQAEQHDLDMFIEATREGRPLYLAYGCEPIEEGSLSLGELQPMVDNNPELIKAVYDNMLPLTWTTMMKRR